MTAPVLVGPSGNAAFSSQALKIYPAVGHCYINDHGPGPIVSAIMRATPLHAGYDEAAAEDSWQRMLAFFAKHL